MHNKTIAVDFDGTLCYSRWPGTGEPNIELIEELIICRKKGDKLMDMQGGGSAPDCYRLV